MRNRALHDQLRLFATNVAGHLTAALESGAEIPFEVAESPGSRSVLYRYRPLSDQFLRGRFAELRGVEGFVETVLALSRIEGASAYLRAQGSSYVPADERDRAEAVLTEFLARLWEESTTFEPEENRFERTYASFESIIYEDSIVNTVLAPLLGVRLAGERWELGSGISLVRGDLCDAPAEAVWASSREDEHPNTLVVLSVEATPNEAPPLTAARLDFRKLLTALRLLKPGHATLGQNAWWRTDDGPWQSVPLGFAGRSRGADYWLEASDLPEIVSLLEFVRSRPAQGGSLPWALARFELGCEQPTALEGLSDHLLALRALLDGAEPSPAVVATRLAAICAEPARRAAVCELVEQAFKLERLVMRGNVDAVFLEAIDADSPDRIARRLEAFLRSLLRDMVCGHLDADVRRTADELLAVEAQDQPAVRRVAARPPAQREPVLEDWSDVATDAALETAHVEAPEARFATRRASTLASERETEETIAVGGIRELRGDDDVEDWGFDDPANYSAAV